MAAPAQPPPSPSVSAILDQLDELETLMRRMLTVPVQQAEGGAQAAASPPTPVPQAAGKPRLPPEPPRQETAARNEEQSEPARPRAETPRKDEPSAPRRPVVVTPARAPWTPPASFPERPNAPAPGVLVGLDRGFERMTRLLGPVGGWFRGEDGRSLLGGLGLLLLAGAIAWGTWDWWQARAVSDGAAPLAPAQPRR